MNKWVFRVFFNDTKYWSTFLITDGNEFHRVGAVEESGWSPKVFLDLKHAKYHYTSSKLITRWWQNGNKLTKIQGTLITLRVVKMPTRSIQNVPLWPSPLYYLNLNTRSFQFVHQIFSVQILKECRTLPSAIKLYLLNTQSSEQTCILAYLWSAIFLCIYCSYMYIIFISIVPDWYVMLLFVNVSVTNTKAYATLVTEHIFFF